MNKLFKLKREWIILLLLSAPLIFMYFVWNQLPNKIPMHFNFMGEPDSWTDKINNVYLNLGIGCGLYLLMLFLPKIDPKKESFKLFAKEFYIMRVFLQFFFAAIMILSMIKALHADIEIGRYIINMILLLFVVLGNFFGKLRHNYTVGIKVPWTLSSEEVWTKTHRMAGKYWVCGPIITAIIGLFVDQMFFGILFVINMVIITIVPIVYSYLVYLKITKENEN